MIAIARPRSFITLWTLAIVAAVCAFVLHLALRGKTVALGYELGRARAEQARLREVKRVLQVESASYKTPERVEIVARTLLGMEPPPPDRIVSLPALSDRAADRGTDKTDKAGETKPGETKPGETKPGDKSTLAENQGAGPP